MAQNKVILWVVVVLIVLVGGYFLITAPTEEETSPIKIGAAFPLTGDASIWGEVALNGIKLAVQEINDEGGINNRKIELIMEDTRSTSKDSVSAVSKLQNIDKVKSILVGWLDVYQGAESVLKPNTLMISPDAGIEAVNGVKIHPNVFSTWYRTQPKSELAIKHMANSGAKKLYIIAQNDSYYTTAVSYMEEAAKKYGIEIVGKDMLNPGTDIQSILVKVADKKPDVVFVALYDEKENVGFLKKGKILLGSKIVVYGDEFVQQNYTRTDYNKDWFEGFYFYGPKIPNIKFFNKYKSVYNVDPVFGASTAYDSVYIIAKAVKDNPSDLDLYMRKTKFDTVSYGTVTFDTIGGITTLENYFVMKQIKNGVSVDIK
ncbi:MAG: ABC transporter substrate-binding protein [Candidatus Paceibacterota bacterium]